jgi:kynurenine formamidase
VFFEYYPDTEHLSLKQSTVRPGEMKPYGALPVPKLTTDLLALVRTGTVYSLSVIWQEGIPALCHIGERQDADGNPSQDGEVKLFNQDGQFVRAADNVDFHGQKHLSIAEMPPIITRGVLIDVARYKGVDVLPDGAVITAAEVQATLEAQGTLVKPGTAVLVRTGFYHHLSNDNLSYRDAIAGLGLEAAQWLHQQGMILAGADNMTVEAVPPLDHSVHRYLLVHHGVTHLENLYLEALAAEQVYEFLLIVTPLRLQGATGSWVHPIAIA